MHNTPKLRFKDENGNEFPKWEKHLLSYYLEKSINEKPKIIEKTKLITVKLHKKGIYINKNTESLSLGATYFIRKKGQFIYGKQNLFNGAFGIIPDNLDNFLSSSDVPTLNFKKDLINEKFFLFFLGREHYYKNLEIFASGTGSKRIHENTFLNLKVLFPCIEEQEKIASFLNSVDTKIEQLTKKEALLQEYKKGVMSKIFNQEIRFKDDNGNEFPEWEENKIKEIFDITRGNVLSMTLVSEKKDNHNIYPVYSSQTKNNGLSGFFDKFLFENCITWTTDGAGAGDVNYRDGKFYCTNVCGVLKSDKGYANKFIAELLNTISRKYVSYVGNPKLMNNVMAEIKISIPKSIKEQTKIANFLSSIDKKIELTTKEINSTKEFKKALLQQMFI
jgi:type I restriction enzyme S subunit